MYLERAGMICSVGNSARAACAAIRAAVSGHEDIPFYTEAGQIIVGDPVHGIAKDLDEPERLVELLAAPLSECLADESECDNIVLVISLAERGRPGISIDGTDMIRDLGQRLGIVFDQRSTIITHGHIGGLDSLQMARKLLTGVYTDTCIICGVDSYLNSNALRWLETTERLKTETNSDGVIPGEAAAAVLVRRRPRRVSAAHVQVLGLGHASESASILSEEPQLGLGMTAAMRMALDDAGLQMHDVGFRISDVTGEHYGFREQSLTLARTMRVRLDELPLWCIADCIGDVGAAAGICQLVVARDALLNGYAPASRVSCAAAAVNGARAVAILGLAAATTV